MCINIKTFSKIPLKMQKKRFSQGGGIRMITSFSSACLCSNFSKMNMNSLHKKEKQKVASERENY